MRCSVGFLQAEIRLVEPPKCSLDLQSHCRSCCLSLGSIFRAGSLICSFGFPFDGTLGKISAPKLVSYTSATLSVGTQCPSSTITLISLMSPFHSKSQCSTSTLYSQVSFSLKTSILSSPSSTNQYPLFTAHPHIPCLRSYTTIETAIFSI